MMDYNPSNKLYLVKRVHVPFNTPQAKKDEQSKESSDSGSESDSSGSGVRLQGVEGEAGRASDDEQKAPQPDITKQQVHKTRYCVLG